MELQTASMEILPSDVEIIKCFDEQTNSLIEAIRWFVIRRQGG